MAVRTQPDALKVFAAIAMIVNSREDSAKVKLTKPSELLAGFRRRFVDVQVNTHLGIIVLRTA